MDELLSGWGRTAWSRADVRAMTTAGEVARVIGAAAGRDAGSDGVAAGGGAPGGGAGGGGAARGVVARGLARSYGDAAQNAGGTVLDLRTDAGLDFAVPASGVVTCPAGVSLDALLRHVVPQGWFVPVTPGTRQVTLGGALAADVHGKNHHRDGTISAHVTAVELVDGTGTIRTLTPADELFWAVPGGMGLTGVITSVSLRLRPITSAWMTVRTERTADLDATVAALASADTSTYSVAWVDCVARGAAHGRGIVTSAEHTDAVDLDGRRRADALDFGSRLGVPAPLWAPSGLLNRASIGAFNTAYFRAAPARPRTGQHHAAAFFHPLDAVHGWNRLYGRAGLVQYQFVAADLGVVRWALAELADAKAPSFLTVLKRFGGGNRAPLSFPSPGFTLAVDLPGSLPGLGALLDRIDERVVASGGRVYLAKDSRLRPELLPAMYPELDRWRELRAELDPRGLFVSDLSRRLLL